jgi:hypothetical protein
MHKAKLLRAPHAAALKAGALNTPTMASTRLIGDGAFGL